MRSTLQKIAADPGLDIAVCVTGMHLSERYGMTITEIESAGLPICARIVVACDATTGAEMARSIGSEIVGMVDCFAREQPDAVLVLGDRGEMLAGAITALHLNLALVHIHGGERSGSVDEPMRHAISKLAHYHLVATDQSRDRLIRMGEPGERIFVTGAPGLDGLTDHLEVDRAILCRAARLNPDRAVALLVFHPVVQQAAKAREQIQTIVSAVRAEGFQIVALLPNADAGGNEIREVLEGAAREPGIAVAVHFERSVFVSWMATADVMIGNSSSGIIEAATLGVPVVNVGDRQMRRERNANVMDVPVEAESIRLALRNARQGNVFPKRNIYGEGLAGGRIVDLLKRLPLDISMLDKTNAY